MAFQAFVRDAEIWANQSKFFKILSIQEEENQVTFATTENHPADSEKQFYVVFPQQDGDKWQVWSNQDDVIQAIADVQDYIDSSREKTLVQILERVEQSLHKAFNKSSDACNEASDDENEQDEDYDEDFDEQYYVEDDEDAKGDEEKKDEDVLDDDMLQFIGQGSTIGVKRLYSDLKNMRENEGKFHVVGKPRGDNLFVWDVKLINFPEDTRIGQDLKKYAEQYNAEPVVNMEMAFPSDYPMSPPFVRIIKPRLKFLTGHITVGGSICAQMLTKSGWTPTNDIEAILVQVRALILSDPNSRLDSNPNREYTEAEARSAFNRMLENYGWNKTVPNKTKK